MEKKRLDGRTLAAFSWLCLGILTAVRVVYGVAASKYSLFPPHIPTASPEQYRFIASTVQGAVSVLIQLLLAAAFISGAVRCVCPLFLTLLVDRICHAVPSMGSSMTVGTNLNYRLFLLEAVILLVFAYHYGKGEKPFAAWWWLPAAVTLCRTLILVGTSMSETGKGFFPVLIRNYELLLTAGVFALTGCHLQALRERSDPHWRERHEN